MKHEIEEGNQTSRANRRGFIGGTLALVGAVLTRSSTARAARPRVVAGPEDRLKELGITLPDPPSPVATYVPAVISGNLLFVSGHGPARIDGVRRTGKVGVDLNLDEANQAARATGLAILSTMKHTLGSLDRVVRLVRSFGMVNAAPDFGQQPQVINGYSDLMVEIFGEEMGKGARAAVGMGSLPTGIAVEIECIWEIRA